ncbi:MAG TPA: hypothetical protein VGF95_06135 [Solirubrobacteraceae bacterium]|jgi:hypothetical protein
MNLESRFEREEAINAASEAAMIGGGPIDPEADPAQWPVTEAGGGESEGFEEAERMLIEHASHADQQSAHAILHDQGAVEEENLRHADAEADAERSSELNGDGA